MDIGKAAKSFGCSYTSFLDYCKLENIKLPPQGYWQRRNAGHSHEKSLHSVQKIRKPMNLLSENQVKEIRLLSKNGIGCREIGRTLNIHHTKVSSLLRGKTYIGIGLI
jgi:hypothetical protein